MIIDHIAIWTSNLEGLKEYYIKHFGGIANEKYVNEKKLFESYFITFSSGARLELMRRTGIPGNLNDRAGEQHLGIIHLAFAAGSRDEVEKKAKQLQSEGFIILNGPRVTGDGYYEFETLDPDGNRLEVSFPVFGTIN